MSIDFQTKIYVGSGVRYLRMMGDLDIFTGDMFSKKF